MATRTLTVVTFMKMKLVHYGHSCFDPMLWTEPHQDLFDAKPSGGLWTSPVGSRNSWSRWCKTEDFETQHLQESFTLTIKGNIFIVGDDSPRVSLKMLNYLKVDAVYLPESQLSNPAYYGWDCETVWILNPDCIELRRCVIKHTTHSSLDEVSEGLVNPNREHKLNGNFKRRWNKKFAHGHKPELRRRFERLKDRRTS